MIKDHTVAMHEISAKGEAVTCIASINAVNFAIRGGIGRRSPWEQDWAPRSPMHTSASGQAGNELAEVVLSKHQPQTVLAKRGAAQVLSRSSRFLRALLGSCPDTSNS